MVSAMSIEDEVKNLAFRAALPAIQEVSENVLLVTEGYEVPSVVVALTRVLAHMICLVEDTPRREALVEATIGALRNRVRHGGEL